MSFVRTHVIPLDLTSITTLRSPHSFFAHSGTKILGAVVPPKSECLVIALAEPEPEPEPEPLPLYEQTGQRTIWNRPTDPHSEFRFTVFAACDRDPWPEGAVYLTTYTVTTYTDRHVATVHFGAIVPK